MDNIYEDAALIRARIDAGEHRAVIGGLWDELGRLQSDLLVSAGLKPHHRLIDVGCGSLRGGVHFIRYLDPFNYHGMDINQSLIEAGLTQELTPDEAARVRDDNFCTTGTFDFAFGETRFDFAIALSLFSHLPQNKIELCLHRLRPWMAPAGGTFLASFFEAPDGDPFASQRAATGITTYSFKDPFHYDLDQISSMARRTGWQFKWIGDVKHPRNQKIARFFTPGPRA